jgi:putative peptidoglycan lipid II flippase
LCEKRLLSTISAVALVTFSAKILGFVREAVQASIFGTSALTDLYTSAGNATTYLFTTAAYALCVAAVPILTQKIASDREEGFRAAGNLLTIVFCFSLLLTAAGLVFPWSPLFAGPLEAASHGTLLLFTRIFMLSLPVICCTYLVLSLLLSMEHYLIQGSLSLPTIFS